MRSGEVASRRRRVGRWGALALRLGLADQLLGDVLHERGTGEGMLGNTCYGRCVEQVCAGQGGGDGSGGVGGDASGGGDGRDVKRWWWRCRRGRAVTVHKWCDVQLERKGRKKGHGGGREGEQIA